MDARDDEALIAACRRGERSALETVFRQHAMYLQRQVERLVGPYGDADDLVQTTLIAAIDAFPRFRGEASVRTWLARIAVHVVHDHLRRPDRRRRVGLELVTEEHLPTDRDATVDRRLDARRRLARLYEHLDALDPKQRLAFVLHVLDDRPIADVAALMGATRSATKSRVFWARLRLLRRIGRDPALKDLLAAGGLP